MMTGQAFETGMVHQHRLLRVTVLLGSLTIVGFITYSLIRYPQIVSLYPSDSVVYLSIAACLVIGYVWLALRRTITHSQIEAFALRQGIVLGLAVGMLWIIEIWAGNLANPQPGVAEFVVHAVYSAAILAVLVVSVFATARAVRLSKQFSTGVWVGLWSGILSALIVFITIMLMTLLFPNAAQTDPQMIRQFAQSGFPDFPTFSMADSLIGMINHLWIGPLLGVICGAIGGALGKA